MDWTESSALWQVTNGEPGTERTDDAYRWLSRIAIYGPAVSLDEVQSLADRLLDTLYLPRRHASDSSDRSEDPDGPSLADHNPDEAAAQAAAPEPDLREHCREFHSRITLRGQTDEKVASAHGRDHHQFGSHSHHHGPNAGPHARPRGWRDGSGVVLIDRQAAMRPRRNQGDTR
jgi:hypothetical protein